MHHHNHHPEDVSRLLDPAYTGSSFSSSSSSSSSYVMHKDRHGRLHDPDYRYFPSTPTYPNKKSKSQFARPSWEGAEEDLELYDSEDVQPKSRPSRRYNTPTYTYPSPSTSYSSTTSTSSSSSPSSPTSFSFTLSDTDHHHPSHIHALAKRLRHKRASSVEEHIHPDEFDDASSLDTSSSSSCAHSEELEKEHWGKEEKDVGCGEAMKKQWQSVQLSVRFGVFRAQRRVKEVLKR